MNADPFMTQSVVTTNCTHLTVTEALSMDTFDFESTYYCKRCRRVRDAMNFRGSLILYKTCITCRHRNTPAEVIALDDMIMLDSLHQEYTGPSADDDESDEVSE